MKTLKSKTRDKIIIIDFGSQVTKLIARRVRDLGVYSEIITPKELIKLGNFQAVKGIIFSGGPSTVTKKKFQPIEFQEIILIKFWRPKPNGTSGIYRMFFN